jgi:hypothetical protein
MKVFPVEIETGLFALLYLIPFVLFGPVAFDDI